MNNIDKALRLIEQEASDSTESALIPRSYLRALLNERARLTVQVGNAQDGDCLSGELGTIECAIDNPCGVCRLRMERDRLLALLRSVQNVGLRHDTECPFYNDIEEECGCGLGVIDQEIEEALK
jgi:hypothetical protein